MKIAGLRLATAGIAAAALVTMSACSSGLGGSGASGVRVRAGWACSSNCSRDICQGGGGTTPARRLARRAWLGMCAWETGALPFSSWFSLSAASRSWRDDLDTL